jgi:hypothetical protein
MKNKEKGLALMLCFSLFGAMAVGSGSTSGDSSPSKVGEVETTESKAETTETGTEETEQKTEYHVGDVLKDSDMQIVYVASGEYKEENEFLQPQDGNKYIFIKLAFENQGSSDASVSVFSFEGYADGYNVDAHYTDNDLSATLSPGRTTEGTVVFEVPQDAQDIEIEYETNAFTGDKIKFIYDGDKDSGYATEANTGASENAFAVGDIVESSDLNISYISCEKDTSYDSYFAPESGYHYVTLTFEFENKGSGDEYISNFDFDCYADGRDCEMAYFRDDSISATLSTGRKAKGTVTFTVPDDAETVEVEYVSNYWTSSRVIFTVSE